MQLLRDQLEAGTLCYLGHSAGLIMAGPNILPATFKGIDALSVCTQPYNAPFVRLPPPETPETFYVRDDAKNDLVTARSKMLELMARYGAWRGYRVVEASAFPHYDARPREASFPQSAETYLESYRRRGRFAQREASLLIGPRGGDRAEPADVRTLREATNAAALPCYPVVANGHAVLMENGGLDGGRDAVARGEGAGAGSCTGTRTCRTCPWKTTGPRTRRGGANSVPIRMGSFTGDEDTLAGDRSAAYDGAFRDRSRRLGAGAAEPGRRRRTSWLSRHAVGCSGPTPGCTVLHSFRPCLRSRTRRLPRAASRLKPGAPRSRFDRSDGWATSSADSPAAFVTVGSAPCAASASAIAAWSKSAARWSMDSVWRSWYDARLESRASTCRASTPVKSPP